ncbi:MAG: DUF1778 domain-containing protein [Rhodospirillaceae bacterium]|nr:DUF1778 domain-containing protein [Rhodospirillaceae bacterium]
MAEVQTKDERLQVRLDAHAKSLLQRAADYTHKSISQFVLSTALEKAERVVSDNEIVTLSNRDWSAFYDALNKPPAPNAKLKQAFKRYKKVSR